MLIRLNSLFPVLSVALIAAAGCVTDPGHEEPPVDPFTIEEINGDYSVSTDPMITLTSTLNSGATDTAEASVEEIADGLEVAGDGSTATVAYDPNLHVLTIHSVEADAAGEQTITLGADQVYAYGADGYGVDETAYPEDVRSFGFRDVQIGTAVTGSLSSGCQVTFSDTLSMSFRPGTFEANVKGLVELRTVATEGTDPYVPCHDVLEGIRTQIEDGLVDDTNRIFDIFVANGAIALGYLPNLEALEARLDFTGALIAAGAAPGAPGSISGQVEMLQGGQVALSFAGGMDALMRKLLRSGAR